MSGTELLGGEVVSLPRAERTRARVEDFHMIDHIRPALALLESKWSLDVIILLASGIHRHARLVDNMPGVSKKVLSATLRRLEQAGIVSRQVYPEIPVRVEYTLTSLGWQFTEPLMGLYEWALGHENELAALRRSFGQSLSTVAEPSAA
jgi:DNA-binding HxlR family transcriptional regulator